ncbi:MAG: acylphosphatase [Candidatus Xenobia bacterium]
MQRRLELRISGRVQGVGFRWFVQRRAERLPVSGYVRNLSDGRVEVVAEGPEVALQEMLRHIRQGPPASRVDHVEEQWETPRGDLQPFTIAG